MFSDSIKERLQKLFLKLGFGGGSVNIAYINGPDSLPKPLTPDEEAKLLENTADPSNRKTLVERNLRLVVFLSKKFENTGVGIEDLISIGPIGLIKAINTFHPDKNIKLATYASRCIENEILMYLRKGQGKREISIDEPLNVDWDGNELLLSDILAGDEDCGYRRVECEEEKRAVYDALSRLNPREKQIIEMRFGLSGDRELTQKEVATALGISQSYISRLEKKIIEHLREEMKSII